MSLADDLQQVIKNKGPLVLLRYAAEALPIFLLMLLFRVLPLDAASNFGSWIGRSLGPKLGVHRRATRNLHRAMPELSAAQRKAILIDMWENLGRTMAEYPHLAAIVSQKRVSVVGLENVRLLRDDGKAGLVVGGHIGNWEILPLIPAKENLPLAIVYRKPNNPFIAALLDLARVPLSGLRAAKGPSGGLTLFRHLKQGGHAGILVDQKLNEGLRLNFFGMPAMTAPAVAQWALRLDAPIMMTRAIRAKNAKGEVHFRIECDAPLPMPAASETATAEIMQTINDRLEAWIRETPSQWLWLHNRWVESEDS